MNFKDTYYAILCESPRTDRTRKVLAICNAFFSVWYRDKSESIDDIRLTIARDARKNITTDSEIIIEGLMLGADNVRDYQKR